MLPKIKVFDFLTNIFKMFNLVAYFEDTELVVKTLNQYYLDSGRKDFYIDEYVDSSSSEVNRSEVYSEINYEYEKPKTIFAIQSNEATNDEYGNERFKSEGDNVFDEKSVLHDAAHGIYAALLAAGAIGAGWQAADATNLIIKGLEGGAAAFKSAEVVSLAQKIASA